MTFVVPAAAGDKPENRFEFSLPGSKKKYSVPHFEFLTGDQLILVAKIEGQDLGPEAIVSLFALTDELTDAPLRKLGMDQLMAFYSAWADASAVAPGESDGSPNSSESTDSR